MAIGIISNPYSGKDIRRIISSAIVSDSGDKMNTIERIIIGSQAFGPIDIVMNPDKGSTAKKIEKRLKDNYQIKSEIKMLDYPLLETAYDSIRAARWMEQSPDISCVIILGGDGTNRVVAKELKTKPIISVSTGTNNVYPQQLEGTIVGISAAIIDYAEGNALSTVRKDKRINIYIDDELVDIALVDAVVTNDIVIGSKAIWELDSIELIVVTRCHPASTGFSSILGSHLLVSPKDPYGAIARINGNYPVIITAAAPGGIAKVSVEPPHKLQLGEEFTFTVKKRGVIALDGEREIILKKGEKVTFVIEQNGPLFVDVIKTIEEGLVEGYFLTSEKPSF